MKFIPRSRCYGIRMKQFTSLLAYAASVAAHGFVQNATIGGKEYDVLSAPILSWSSAVANLR